MNDADRAVPRPLHSLLVDDSTLICKHLTAPLAEMTSTQAVSDELIGHDAQLGFLVGVQRDAHVTSDALAHGVGRVHGLDHLHVAPRRVGGGLDTMCGHVRWRRPPSSI